MRFDLLANHVEDGVAAVGPFENPLPEAIDPLPLLVHHLVVFEQVFAGLEVPLFDLLLGRFDPPRDHAAFDPLAFLHAERFEDRLDPWPGENPHQVVFERQEEAAAAGIALAAAAAAKLQVDAAGFVPLGADHVQAAESANLDPFGLHLLALFDFADERVPLGGRHVEAGLVFVLQARPRPSFRGCRPG